MGFVVPSLFGVEVTGAVGATYWRCGVEQLW